MSLRNSFQPSHTPFDFTKYTQSRFEVDRARIIKELIPLGNGRRAIDIGCGPGYFSRELTALGWKTSSIDTDSQNIERASNHADEIHLGSALDVLPRLPSDQYDLVLALAIIEHMPKSHGKQLLLEIIRVLRTPGTLILATPNRLSLEGLGGYYWGERIRGWSKWNAWDTSHVHIYTSFEVLRLIRTSGFYINKVIGYYFEAYLPFVGNCRLPITKSTVFPLNRFGFTSIIACQKE